MLQNFLKLRWSHQSLKAIILAELHSISAILVIGDIALVESFVHNLFKLEVNRDSVVRGYFLVVSLFTIPYHI